MEVFLETERLLLRRFTESDADLLFELDSDPEVVRYANPGGKTTPYEEIRHRILPRFLSYYERYEGLGFWAAMEKSSGGFVGWFVLRPAEDGGMAKMLAEGLGQGLRNRRVAGTRREGVPRVGCRAGRGAGR